MALYSVAFLGLLAVFLLHVCGKLTTSKVMADKKAGFYRVGVLGMYISTHRGRVSHICVSELTIIGSDNEPMLEYFLVRIKPN